MPLEGIVDETAGIRVNIPKFKASGINMIFPITVDIILIHTVNDTSGLLI